MIENIFTRLIASRRTVDPNVVRFGLRHLAFAAAILTLSLCARAEIPLDSPGVPSGNSSGSPSGGTSDPITKDQTAASPVVEVPRTLLLFNLSVHGSLLYLDWKDNAEAQAIRIYDLQGRLLFAWKPASDAESPASGAGAPASGAGAPASGAGAPASGAGAIGRWIWDGRDAKGSRLEHGHYLISVQTRTGTRNQVFAWGRNR